MDLNKIGIDGEWQELEAVSEKIGKMKFRVRPVTTDIRLSNELEENFVKILADWDFVKGEKKLPCNEVNIRKYMPLISMVEVKTEGDKPTYVGIEIIRFAQNIDNFVKN